MDVRAMINAPRVSHVLLLAVQQVGAKQRFGCFDSIPAKHVNVNQCDYLHGSVREI